MSLPLPCIACGAAPRLKGRRYCGPCRARRAQLASVGRPCPRCGGERSATATYCRPCGAAYKREQTARQPGHHSKLHAAWVARNRERNREIDAKSYQKCREKRTARQREYIRTHPEEILAGSHRRRARQYGAPGYHTAAQWRELLASYHGLCVYCHAPATGRDHIVPLIHGGSNDISNIVPACGACNCRKKTMTVLRFLVRRAAA